MLYFIIDCLPPSYNRSFNINYNFREVTLSREAHIFKTKVKAIMPPIEFPANSLFHLELEYHADFKFKNGKNRKIDLQNMDKLLIDAIFERLGLDDSAIWELQEKKVQDNREYTVVSLKEL